eukprot:TRINITY_DN5557_c0_g1_i1.p1 TRINITY_DN5557_c0_g1~~TRINITY_DN5557_c0_g1_i1.p1  ORF type:complete len:495 (+),score=101.22 TRINITY_DN5557_c0_g1_i1:73-1557(+)
MHTYFVTNGSSLNPENSINAPSKESQSHGGGVPSGPKSNAKGSLSRVEKDVDMKKLLRKYTLEFIDPEKEKKFQERYYSAVNDLRWPLGVYAIVINLWLIFDAVKLDGDLIPFFVGTRIGIDFVAFLGLIAFSYTPYFHGRNARLSICGAFSLSSLFIFLRLLQVVDTVEYLEEDDDYFAADFEWFNSNFYFFTSFMSFFPKMRFIDAVAINGVTYILMAIIYAMAGFGFMISYASFLVVFFILCSFISYNMEHFIRQTFALALDIQEESKLLAREQSKTKQLLLSILPEHIYEQLKEFSSTIAEKHEGACILYADIVGFTVMSGEMDANALLSMLNSIFFIFDTLCIKYNLQKLKTLGDCVVIAGGVMQGDGKKVTREEQQKHLESMLRLSLEIHEEAKKVSEKLGREIQFRAGIAMGSVIAGVIGKAKFAYDMWGDTVKEANRMESSGVPGRSQVSREIYESMNGIFNFEENRKEESSGFLIHSLLQNQTSL